MNNALAPDNAAITLADLKPPVGTRVQLECAGSRDRMSCELLGYREGTSIMVSAPRVAGKVVEIADGSVIKVRLLTGTSLCGFSATLLCRYDAPFAHWHVSYPASITHKRVRNHTRVPVNLVISADEFEEGMLEGGTQWPHTLLCKNLSLTGAGLLSKVPLGKPDDRLYLTFRLCVAGHDQVVMVPAIIRNVPLREGDYQYGVEFFDLDEDARLVLAGFVYQQCLRETGYRDYLVEGVG